MTTGTSDPDSVLPPTATADEADVLYVDADADVRERTRAGIERRRDELSVTDVGDVETATERLESRSIDCLVADPDGLDGLESVVEAVVCPLVLYTGRDPEVIGEWVSEHARTIVEKGDEADRSAFLAEKIHSVVSAIPDRTNSAVAAARERVSAASGNELAVLLAPDETVSWTSGPLATVLPDPEHDAEPDSLFDRLDAVVASEGQASLEQFRTGSETSVTLPVAGGEWHRSLLVRRYDAPGRAEGGQLVLLSDVSDQVRRIAQRDRLELLVDRAQDGLYTLDEDGVIDDCNESFARTLGYDRESLIGTHASAVLAPGELTKGQRTVERLLRNPERQTTTVELWFRRADGTDRLLSIRYTLLLGPEGTYHGLMGAVRDVTERHERERTLEQQRALFESLVEHFPNGGVFLFDDDLRFVEAGGQELDPLGLEAEKMVGRRPTEIFPSENASLLEDHYRAALRGEHSSFEDTYQGNRYHVQTIPIPGNDAAAGMAVAQNVTEQRERQWELERSNTLLSTLLDTLPLGILVEDSDREITTVNHRFLDMFELLRTPAEIVGTDCVAQARDVCDLFVDPETFVDGVAAVPDEHPARHDEALELHDGRIFERSAVPVELPDGRGTIWLYRDVTDRIRHERELAETTERLDLALEGAELAVWDWDIESGAVTRNERWAEMLGYDSDEIAGEFGEWAQRIHPDDRERAETELAAHFDGETDFYQCDLRLQTKSGEYRWIRDSGKVFERDEAGEPVRAVGIHQDITERKEQKRELQRQRDELEMLARTHSLIQDVIRALSDAASRSEIEEIVCGRLVESTLYEFAWVGEQEGRDKRLATRTAAGDGDGYLETVRERATAEDREHGPGTTAIRTGEVQVVRDVTDEPMMSDWQDEALERGYRSAAAIPLVHTDVVHGVLVVYATRADVFSERAVESFVVLGEMIGFALTAVQNRQLLSQDTVLELTYRSQVDDPLLTVARELGCHIEVSGSVSVQDGFLEYLTVTDGSPSDVLDAIRDRAVPEDVRIVSDDGDSGVIELTTSRTFAGSLLDVGAKLQAAEVTPTGIVVTVEAPTDADPRTIRDVLTDHVSGLELVAKHEQERSPTPLTDELALGDQLTERQLEVLRAAYLAGYYAWPRDTTAEQLSDTLDIASPTLHQHLRRAQRNLLEALFDK